MNSLFLYFNWMNLLISLYNLEYSLVLCFVDDVHQVDILSVLYLVEAMVHQICIVFYYFSS